MSTLPQVAQDFLNKLGQFMNTWDSVEIKTLAYRIGDRWVNLCASVSLSITKGSETEEKLFEVSKRLVVLRKIVRIDYDGFKSILERLNGGYLTVGDTEVFFDAFSSPRLTEEKSNWRFDQLSDGEGWPALILISQGKTIPNIMKEEEYNELNKALIMQKTPLDDLTRLSLKYLGLKIGFNYPTNVYVIAPVYFKLDDMRVSDEGESEISVKCHKSFVRGDLSLSVLYYDGLDTVYGGYSLLDGYEAQFDHATDIDDNFVKYSTHQKRKCQHVLLARCNVIYKGTILQTYEFAITSKKKETNMRLVAHEVLDDDLDGLLKGLNATKKKHFEPAVTMLLHLVGFDVEHIGGIEEAIGRSLIDFLAFAPDNSYVMVGGCTVEGITPDDVTKIAEKAKTLRREFMMVAQGPMTVEPVLITSLTLEEVSESVKKRAEEDELTIIEKNTLEDILEKIRSGGTTDQLLNEFRNIITLRRQAKLVQQSFAAGAFQSLMRGRF